MKQGITILKSISKGGEIGKMLRLKCMTRINRKSAEILLLSLISPCPPPPNISKCASSDNDLRQHCLAWVYAAQGYIYRAPPDKTNFIIIN